MKIAIATDDKKHIRKGHFGESTYFYVVELDDTKIINSEFLENPFQDHNIPQKSKKILEHLAGCQAIMGRGFGHKSIEFLSSKGIEAIVSSEEVAEKALEHFVEKRSDIFKSYDLELKKFKALW